MFCPPPRGPLGEKTINIDPQNKLKTPHHTPNTRSTKHHQTTPTTPPNHPPPPSMGGLALFRTVHRKFVSYGPPPFNFRLCGSIVCLILRSKLCRRRPRQSGTSKTHSFCASKLQKSKIAPRRIVCGNMCTVLPKWLILH